MTLTYKPYSLPDEKGVPLPPERMELLRSAMAAVLALTEHERGYIFCWFCRGCNRYVGPGESCFCTRDE